MTPEDTFADYAAKLLACKSQEGAPAPIEFSIIDVDYASLSGYIRIEPNGRATIARDKNFLHDLQVIIKSLLADESAIGKLPFRKIIPDRDPQFQAFQVISTEKQAEIRQLITQTLELGLPRFLLEARQSDHLVCRTSNTVLSVDVLKSEVAKVASHAAMHFVLLHEMSHLLCGHLSYKRQLYSQLKAGESESKHDATFKLLEYWADINAASSCFPAFSAMRSEFMAEPLDYAFENGLYLSAFSSGMGVGVYFLSLDSLSSGVMRPTHPTPSERVAWLSMNFLSSCPNEPNNPESESAAALLRLYHRGVFHGMSEAFRLWDLRRLPREKDAKLDAFIFANLPCPICNGPIEAYLRGLSRLAQEFEDLEGAMMSTGHDWSAPSLMAGYVTPRAICEQIKERVSNVEQKRRHIHDKVTAQARQS